MPASTDAVASVATGRLAALSPSLQVEHRRWVVSAAACLATSEAASQAMSIVASADEAIAEVAPY